MLLPFIVLLFQPTLLSGLQPTSNTSNCSSFQDKSHFVFYCVAGGLFSIPSHIPPQTHALLLSFNRIPSISQDSFSGLLHLQTLLLGGQVTPAAFSVGKSAFRGFPNLITLDLGGNRNISLHPEAFEGLSRLEVLFLDNNGLDESVLESGMFKDLTSLKKLDLSSNKIHRVRPDPSFLKLTSISVILLKLNKINLICGDELQSLQGRRLQLLDLSSNPLQVSSKLHCTNPFNNLTLGTLDISSMGWDAKMVEHFFRTISGTKVDYIKMRHAAALGSGFGFNNLKDPNKGTFSGLNSSNVQILDLSNGYISHLAPQLFSAFPKLLSLDLSSNKINRMSTGAFSGLGELVSLNLSGNLLGELMGNSFQGLGTISLKALDLSSNHIGDVQYGALDTFTALESLNLRDNALKKIPRTKLPGVTLVLLKQNRISDTYDIISFCPNATILDLSSNRLTDLRSLWHIQELKALKYLSLSSNSLSRCSLKHASNMTRKSGLVQLDLSNNALGPVLKSGECENIFMYLENLKYLNLARNQLSNIPETIFRGLSSLHTLDLSENVFKHIQSNLFTGLTALKSLNLGKSNLVTLSSSVLEPLVSLESIDLSEVTLTCDCSLVDFWNWLNDTNIPVNLGGQEVSCIKPTLGIPEIPLTTFVKNHC
uniref:LRRCT domain-containing protein n=1 Tax=Xenopus laevis TaxID=8355 RepID=B7ZRB7_XENLA|nr:Unknown (protein for MGC:196837) [Xenopus laevis]